MTPPREFVSALRSFDPALRVRWMARTKMWVIERRMEPQMRTYLTEKPAANPWNSDRSKDLFDGWRDGYVHVMAVHPSLLDHRVFGHLEKADAWRQGGMAALAQQIDAEDEAREKAFERDRHNWHEGAGKDLFETIAWDEGRRVAVAETITEEREGFTVVDRRVTAEG